MRDMTKQWINELTESVYYLLINEPWLSWIAIKKEVQGYYDCTSNEFKMAAKKATNRYNGDN